MTTNAPAPSPTAHRKRWGRAYIARKKLEMRCAGCGWQPEHLLETRELQLVHDDPSTRRFRISAGTDRSPETIDAEIAKCTPWCYRCV